MSVFQNPAEKTIAQYAAGLYGVAVGAPTNTQVLAQATTNGLYAVFDQYFELGFEPIKSSVVASLIVSNVGIVAGQYGLTAANVTAAVTYVQAQLDAAKATHTEGRAISELLANFSNMTGDATFGVAAKAWNTQVDKNLAYTSSGALKDVPSAQAVALAPTYAVAVDKVSIAEGETATYTITATGLAAGTEIAYSVTGVGNALASTKVGIVTVNAAGNAVVTVSTADNFVINDAGSLTFKLLNGSTTLATAASVAVTNNDNAATYTVAASDSSITEGDSVTYDITTTGVAPGTDLVYDVSGTGNALASTQSGLTTVNASGKATITINTFNNQVANDSGVLSLKLVNGEVTLATANVSVQNDDVVVNPNLDAEVTVSEPFGTGGITEGDIVQFNIATSGYPVGTVMPYTVTGTHNAAGVVQAGYVTIGVGGVALVQVQTHDNANWGDAGVLTFNLANGLATASTAVANDDQQVIDNVYTLTKEADRFTDINTGDDTFNATVGNTFPTLTTGDKLDGGSGYDVLYIDVDGEDAELPAMNSNTNPFKGIEQVIIDQSDDNELDEEYAPGGKLIYDDVEDEWAVDAEYFDSNGDLEKLTLKADKDVETGQFEDVFVHKDMTVEFIGSGVANNAVELDDTIAIGKDVKNLTIELDGVGGDYSYGGDVPLYMQLIGSAPDQGAVINFIEEEAESLESLTVTGTLAAESLPDDFLSEADDSFLSDIWDVDATLTLTSFGYGAITPQPETITISLDATDDVESIQLILGGQFSPVENLFWAYSGPGQTPDEGLMYHVETLDMSGTNANTTTYLQSAYLGADTVEVTLGTGNDIFALDILPSTDSSDVATAITFDLGASATDKDTIILSNMLTSGLSLAFYGSDAPMDGEDDWGGNIKLDGYNSVRDIDLTEDMITLDNFDTIKDKLSLDLVILHGYSGASEEVDTFTYVGDTFEYEDGNLVQKAADDGADSATRNDERFYGAVEAVAAYLVKKASAISANDAGNADSAGDEMELDEVDQYYAAAFEYDGDTYLYIDTNRNGWDYSDSDSDSELYELNNLGLSNGDTLIKLTGTTDLPVGFDLSAAKGLGFGFD